MPGFNIQIISDTATPMLRRLSSEFRSIVVDMLGEGGQEMEGISRELVRVDTGYLRSTIYYKVNSASLTLELGATADYAFYNEFGTRRMSAQPFIRPAVDGCQDKLLQALMLGIMSAIQ